MGVVLKFLTSTRTTSTARRLAMVICVAALVLSLASLEAGSIFMKNGYIIQGPVIEHSDLEVTLGWNNGKVTIYRRFVDRVDLEPGEEKRIRAVETAPVAPKDEDLVFHNPEEDSIADLGPIEKLYPGLVGQGPSGGDAGAAPQGQPAVTASEPGTAGGEPSTQQTEVTSVPPVDPGTQAAPAQPDPATNAAALEPRGVNPAWGFSLQPPKGWVQREVDGVVVWESSSSIPGEFASINVTWTTKRPLEWEAACKALEEGPKGHLESHEVISKGPVTLDGLTAFQVVVKGRVAAAESGSADNAPREARVAQTLIKGNDRLWILSSFADAAQGDAVTALALDVLRTFKTGS